MCVCVYIHIYIYIYIFLYFWLVPRCTVSVTYLRIHWIHVYMYVYVCMYVCTCGSNVILQLKFNTVMYIKLINNDVYLWWCLNYFYMFIYAHRKIDTIKIRKLVLNISNSNDVIEVGFNAGFRWLYLCRL